MTLDWSWTLRTSAEKISSFAYVFKPACKTNLYYFRVVVPEDLRRVVGKSEIRYSLRTGLLSEAKYRALRMASFVQWLFRDIRRSGNMQELSKAEIQKLIQDHLKEALEETELYRASIDKPLDEQEVRDDLEAMSLLKSDFKEYLATCDYRKVEKTVDSLLEEKGIELSKDGDSYRLLCREMLKSNVEYLDQYEKIVKGEMPLIQAPENTQPNRVIQAEEEPSEPLSKIIEQYVTEQERGGNWTEKTKEEFLACLGLLQEVIGDVSVKSIDFPVMRAYKEALLRLPTNSKKSKKYRDKTVQQLLEMKIPKPMSTTTVNKYLNRASSLFKFAVRNGFMDRNPAEGMQIKQSKRDDEFRSAFSREDLEKLFISREYLQDKHRSSYGFWLPILALFTGCRMEELAQLHLDDIRKEDGVWVIDINNKGEKKAKTNSSIRLVPLHPFLVDDLKLPRYVEKLRKEGYDRLFPELTHRRDGYGQTASNWFARYKVRCGVAEDGKKKDFHSFRHTFADNLKQTIGEDYRLSEVLGHEVPSMTFGRYGKRYRPSVILDEVIKKLDYGVDLGQLKRSRFVK